MKKWIRYIAAALLAAAFMLAAAAFIYKAYSLYMSLCRKVDYLNTLAYSIDTRVNSMENILASSSEAYQFDYSWAEGQRLIAHAFGGVDQIAYTNSLEAFQANYALGHRIFEVDFDLTTPDNTLVAAHDANTWNERTVKDASIPFTYENFMQSRIDGQYTPLDYRGVIDLMIQYPDIHIITDTKYGDEATVYLQFSQLIREALAKDQTVLDRLIPQIYHKDMLPQIMQMYPFKSVILTLYAAYMTPQEAANFCARSGVGFITAPMSVISQDTLALFKSHGLIVASHTSNNPAATQDFFSMGLDMMYTDFLTKEDF